MLGALSMLVYVATGAEDRLAASSPFDPFPGTLRLFSSTSFDKLLDAWARLAVVPFAFAPLADGTAGVEVPLVERPSSPTGAGVAAPLASAGVARRELASFRCASPRMVLMFLLRRGFGRQWGLRYDLGMEWMSSCSMSLRCAAAAAWASGVWFDMVNGFISCLDIEKVISLDQQSSWNSEKSENSKLKCRGHSSHHPVGTDEVCLPRGGCCDR